MPPTDEWVTADCSSGAVVWAPRTALFILRGSLPLQDPLPRLRRRKALPEKLPPMMSPIKSLFGRRTNAGLMLGLPGHQATTGGLPGVCFPGALPASFQMRLVLAIRSTLLRVLSSWRL